MSFSAADLRRRSELIERVEGGLKTLEVQQLLDDLVASTGASTRFKNGTHEFSMDGVRASATAGVAIALRRWVEKARVMDNE